MNFTLTGIMMDMAANTIQNKDLAALAARAPGHIINAITKASAKTGVNFAYMVQQAKAESSFDEDVKAKGSSASGLYQFIESTWLSMVKKYGAQHGMATEAAQIGAKGKVADRATRQEILALRNDPEKASAMAAEFARENEEFLDDHWGGKVGSTELYFAHFMGAGGAAAFLKARDADPTQQAAVLFPAAAKANRNVFYDTSTGRPKTMDEVYAFFDRKFSVKSADTPDLKSSVMVASAKPVRAENETNKVASVIFMNNLTQSKGLVTDDYAGEKQAFHVPRYNSLVPTQNLVHNPVELMFLSQMDLPTVERTSTAKNRL